MARTPRVTVHNSNPLGRRFNNVPKEYFDVARDKKRESRGGSVSLSGLRPSFFEMLRADAARRGRTP